MLQENIFQALVAQKVPVRIFIVNGYQVRGTIVKADESAVVINSDGTYKVVRVAAISTIEPMGAFKI